MVVMVVVVVMVVMVVMIIIQPNTDYLLARFIFVDLNIT